MTDKEQKLVDRYLNYKNNEEEYRKLADDTLKELSGLAPHKVGEIIQWTEYNRKNVGTAWRPQFVDLPPKEKRAVLTSVEISVNEFSSGSTRLNYRNVFNLINKDGSISKNCVYPRCEYQWTGETYSDL